MMNVVRPACRRSSASMTSASVSASSAEVGSSRIRIGESRRMARAMVSRCFSPSDSVTPCSPTLVSYPRGQPHDDLVDAGGLGRRDDLLHPGVGPAEGDVLAQGHREDQRRLEHHGDLPAQRGEPVLADVAPSTSTRPRVGS